MIAIFGLGYSTVVYKSNFLSTGDVVYINTVCNIGFNISKIQGIWWNPGYDRV